VGKKESEPFQFTFNGFLKVAFQGSRVTSDAGLILVRELDEQLGLEAIMAAHLNDSRHGLNTQFPLPRTPFRKVSPAGEYIEGASMSDEGVVVFQGNEYSTPSLEKSARSDRRHGSLHGADGVRPTALCLLRDQPCPSPGSSR
jgi:hypothetical protein